MQQEVRYIYVGVEGGNFTPATADETRERRYGDCKGKTVLLLALLRNWAYPPKRCWPMASASMTGSTSECQSPAMFNHILVRATIDGEQYWLDGTLPPVVPPNRDSVIPYRWVLPLSTAGQSIEKIARKPLRCPG